jgi:hypothetical protein
VISWIEPFWVISLALAAILFPLLEFQMRNLVGSIASAYEEIAKRKIANKK